MKFRLAIIAVATLAGCDAATPDLSAPGEDSPVEVVLARAQSQGPSTARFLPPLVQVEAGSAGPFDDALEPLVRLDLDGMDEPAWNRPAGLEDDHYHLDWAIDSDELWPGRRGRLTVIAEGVELASIEVVFATSGPDLARSADPGVAVLRVGRTVPIKFSIDVGALPRSIELDPARLDFTNTGETAELRATVLNAFGQEIHSPVRWTSTDESVVTVDEFGVTTAVSDGQAEIVAQAGEAVARVPVVVETVWAWELLTPSNTGPQAPRLAKYGFAMYVPDEDAVMVVINRGDYVAGELWRYSLELESWSRVDVSNWPVGKFRDFVHDPLRNEVVVAWDGIGEVWAIPVEGGSWYRRATAPNWQTHYEGSFFFDRRGDRLGHVFGYGLGRTRNDLHYFEEGGWQLKPTSGQAVRARFSIRLAALDPAGSNLYVSGGLSPQVSREFDDLVRLDIERSEWTQIVPDEHVPGVNRVQTALAITDRDVFRWGGLLFRTSDPRENPYANPWTTNELQVLVGSRWQTLDVENPPPPAWRSHLIYDSRRNRLVAFAGTGWDIDGAPVYSVHALDLR